MKLRILAPSSPSPLNIIKKFLNFLNSWNIISPNFHFKLIALRMKDFRLKKLFSSSFCRVHLRAIIKSKKEGGKWQNVACASILLSFNLGKKRKFPRVIYFSSQMIKDSIPKMGSPNQFECNIECIYRCNSGNLCCFRRKCYKFQGNLWEENSG